MDPKANPIRKRGERNIYCPFYNDCLDYAVECFWPSWSCSQCPHKTVQAMPEGGLEINNEDPAYVISSGLVRGGILNEFE